MAYASLVRVEGYFRSLDRQATCKTIYVTAVFFLDPNMLDSGVKLKCR
jgi:hypothetical protein